MAEELAAPAPVADAEGRSLMLPIAWLAKGLADAVGGSAGATIQCESISGWCLKPLGMVMLTGRVNPTADAEGRSVMLPIAWLAKRLADAAGGSADTTTQCESTSGWCLQTQMPGHLCCPLLD